MDPRLEILSKRMKDARGKKVMYVAHCILNENTRYLGGAFRSGCIDEIVCKLQEKGIGIIQMPCPEQKAWGGVLKKHMWRAVGLESMPLYRFKWLFLPVFIWHTKRICRGIAKQIALEMRDYMNSGFEVVGVIGVATSPTCGVNVTADIAKSFESLAGTTLDDFGSDEMNDVVVKKSLVEGSGFFIKALKKEFKRRKTDISFYEHDLLAEMSGQKTIPDIG